MKAVSRAYKNGMLQLLRERSYAIVKFYNIDTEAANDGTWTANGEVSWSSFDTLDYEFEYDETIVTLEWNRWELDGKQDILYNNPRDGFISNKLSDSNGNFSSYCIMERQFQDIHMFPGLTLTFDSRVEEWPTSVTFRFYLNNQLIKEVTSAVTSLVAEIETSVESADKLQIVFNSALPYHRPRVQYIIYGIGREYTNNDILNLEQYTDVDPLSRRLPDETFTFTILDYQHLYDPDNPNGIYRFVDINSPVYVKFGYTLSDGSIEWIKEDHYLLNAQPEVFNNQATFTATGLIGSLTDIYYKSRLGRKSFYQMAEDVLLDAHLTPTTRGKNPWVIDETLTSMYTDAVLPIDTHMNCLQLIAHACRCRLYTDDDNIIHIEQFGVTVSGIFSGSFTDNGHTSYSEWDSVNTGQNVQETYATLEWNRWELNGTQTILPDMPKPTGYISSYLSNDIGDFINYGVDVRFYVDENGDLIAEGRDANDFYLSNGNLYYTGNANIYVEDGNIYVNGTGGTEPYFTRVFDVKNDLPIVGFRFDSIMDEYPELIEVKYYEDDRLLETHEVTPDDSEYHVYSTAENVNKIVVTCKQTLPYYRFRISKVYYRQTDFSLNFDNMTISTQRITKIDKLKNVTVSKTIYTPSERATRLYQATTDEEELHLEFYSAAENITVTLSDGLIESLSVYARAVDLKVTPGMKTITITGNVLATTEAVKTYVVSNKGETDIEENPLITDDDMRDELYKHVANYLQMRNTYDVDYRGNPELEAGDVIGYQTAYTDEFYALVLVDQLRFGGSLSGSVKAKGLLDSSLYDEIKIVAIINPIDSGEVSGSGTYDAGDLVTLTATPHNDYEFGYWMESGERISDENTLQFIATKSRRFTAVFFGSGKITITLFTIPEGAGYVTGGGSYEYGDTVTVKVTPTGGYHFIGWQDEGTMVSTEEVYTFTAEKTRILNAVFQEFTHTVTVSTEGGGTVSGGGVYRESTNVTVTASPRSGYAFVKWTEEGNTVSTDAEYTFIITKDRNLVAVFQSAYRITVNTTSGGTATGDGTYAEGASVVLTATAEAGYDFVGWQLNGEIVTTNNPYIFNATQNATYTAVFIEHIKEVVYYGLASRITTASTYPLGTTVGKYAIFCDDSRCIDAYTESLVKSTALVLPNAVRRGAAVYNKKYALFACGYRTTGVNTYGYSGVYAYDENLSQIQATSARAVFDLASGSVGEYAILAGGDGGTYDKINQVSTVYAYDGTLTRKTATALSSARSLLSGTQNDRYAVFAGGRLDNDHGYNSTTVNAYNSSLSRSTPTSLPSKCYRPCGAGNGEYVIFAGGYAGNSSSTSTETDVVTAYNTALVRSTPTVLTKTRVTIAGTGLGNNVIFAGGYYAGYAENIVEVYDRNLVRKTPDHLLSNAKYRMAAATIGNKALFAGGLFGTNYSTDMVDVYTLK